MQDLWNDGQGHYQDMLRADDAASQGLSDAKSGFVREGHVLRRRDTPALVSGVPGVALLQAAKANDEGYKAITGQGSEETSLSRPISSSTQGSGQPGQDAHAHRK
jgi:hypothetical protein